MRGEGRKAQEIRTLIWKIQDMSDVSILTKSDSLIEQARWKWYGTYPIYGTERNHSGKSEYLFTELLNAYFP